MREIVVDRRAKLRRFHRVVLLPPPRCHHASQSKSSFKLSDPGRILITFSWSCFTLFLLFSETRAFSNPQRTFVNPNQYHYLQRDRMRPLESTRGDTPLDNTSAILKLSLPRLRFKKNYTDEPLGNNLTNQDQLEKNWFRRRLKPWNSETEAEVRTERDLNGTESKGGIFTRVLQYLPLFTKSSGESILDNEVQLSQQFGANLSNPSSTLTDATNNSTSKSWFMFNKNSTQSNDPKPATEVQANNNSSNPVLDLLFGIPSWFVDSMGSWTASVRNSMDEEWIAVCQKTQVSPGAIVPVVAGGINLLIIASKDGKRVYCVANSCPHLGTPLETGMLEQRPTPSVSSLTSLKRKSLSTGGMVSSPTVLNSTDIEGSSESCIVCPLHRTAFALESGEVRGEWCPYPPIIGSIVGLVKPISKLPTFSIRTRGKNIEVLINSLVNEMDESGYSGDKK